MRAVASVSMAPSASVWMSVWICSQPSVSLVPELLCDGGPYGGKIRAVVAEGLGDVLDGLLCRWGPGVDAVDKALRDILADLQ